MPKPVARVVFVLAVLGGDVLAQPAGRLAPWWTLAAELAPSAAAATDFTPHGTQPGLFSSLLSADFCAQCHAPNASSPATADAFLPYPGWAGSMMANATRDPLFWAALDIANHDVPGSGDFCLRCHAPAGWYAGRVVKTAFSLPPPNDPVRGAAGCLLKGAYGAADNANSDFGGITCHTCHRLLAQGPNAEPAYIGNADAWLDDHPCSNGSGNEPCRGGPYAYASGDTAPPHAWAYSAYQAQSNSCGLCHDVSAPDTSNGTLVTLKLDDGSDTGHPFPMQRTYAEWKQSDFADNGPNCQGCHMPVSSDPAATACTLSGYPSRSGNLPVHEFVGGNTWVPGIIKGEYNGAIVAAGGINRSAAFDQTVEGSRTLLGAAASLSLSIADYTAPDGANAGAMRVNVVVTNLGGHKLPTGYAEGRRMWLNLRVTDATGNPIFESAAYDAASGELTVDAQARVYEILQGVWNRNGSGHCEVIDTSGAAAFHSMLDDCIAKDNRIPPRGFRPATAADPNGYDTRPVGAAYPETSPGSGVLVNHDDVDYAVPLPPGTPLPLSVGARLYYQTASSEYVQFLRDEAAQAGIPAENLMCSGAPERPFTVGPQNLTRGEFLYRLWNEPIAAERIFANGFDEVAQTGYGRSPPELMQVAVISTPLRAQAQARSMRRP